MLAQIQAGNFLFVRHAQANGRVDHFQNNEREDERVHPCREDSNRLYHHLPRIAEEEAVGAGGIDRLVANRPVASAPHVPPTPCTPTTSSASSYPNLAFMLQ